MLLDSITSPADLRPLTAEQLAVLASEIRSVVVDTVARNAGHLGSNLGVVELTLALHRVFQSPHDRILWDTGHQAYVHKLVTGRRGEFDQLRRPGGLSGYPSRTESEHDWIENSHASTVLSYAHGLAMAEDLRRDAALHRGEPEPDRREVVAVIGDGALTGGMAYEALNNLGHTGRKAIIILNDNGRSYAPTVGRLTASVSRLRLDPRYVRQRRRAEVMVRQVPGIGQHLAWGLSGARAGLREMLEPPIFFETLGVRYSGPFDGHDIELLEEALRNAAEYDGPVVVHVLTTKGKGYPPAEQDEEKCLHDTSAFNPEIGPQPASGGAPSYTAAFTEAIVKEGEARPELVAITAAMPGSTGLLPFQERFPDRFVDVGIAEQHAVTAAAGMAMGGLRPVVAVYSTFLSRAFDQANLDVGLHGLPVVFCLDRAGITGDDGPSHHGVLDLVLLSKVPGMTIFAPSSYQELQVMLHDALDLCTGPAALRWAKTPAREVADHEVGHGLSARQARHGGDVCLVGVGKMLGTCLDAADLLAANGIEATVWDPRVVKPLDPALLDHAATFGHVITVEDGLADGGIGASIARELSDRCRARPTEPRVTVLGTPTAYIAQGKADAILADLGLDAAGVAATVRAALGS
ncbi:MAG TPA: 1-deoxy-D-xylulose-5-phosphate synthase [Acidimicrobiales bacterium]|jgi:1-deoxy-D-xylulose-5-phosphate synthase|nr:1-deoxy-D-xylulose-5-phosphate synthase [Acidimicrobiales bacterium]HMS88274.1 1-deoxy-D-xylulose-5-phosphate synthase [Acidimicrobiales bacterium]HRA34306.1 1-deoxy-D-xylulose-5-phosphate synthase [Acidimicrobiales bacterium]